MTYAVAFLAALLSLAIGFALGRWSREPAAVVDRDGPVEWQW